MASHIVRVEDRPDLEHQIERPGGRPKPGTTTRSTRFLGLPGEDFVSPKRAPFAYHIRRPKGDVTPDHCHTANRIEYVIEGKIEWREPEAAPVVYGAGTLTYVEAGTVYGYTVIEDATILIVFDEPPGIYNLNTAGIVAASGTWETDKPMADEYISKMGHGFGNGFWGEPMEDVFRLALSGTEKVVHSSSTMLYGALDNDDFFIIPDA